MSDITMCKGDGCPMRARCYRHTAKPSEFRQAYFVTPPVRSGARCDYFTPTSEFGDGDYHKEPSHG